MSLWVTMGSLAITAEENQIMVVICLCFRNKAPSLTECSSLICLCATNLIIFSQCYTWPWCAIGQDIYRKWRERWGWQLQDVFSEVLQWCGQEPRAPMKGKDSCGDAEMWKSLCFQGTTSTFTFPVLNSHAHMSMQIGTHTQWDKCIRVHSL